MALPEKDLARGSEKDKAAEVNRQSDKAKEKDTMKSTPKETSH